MKKIISVIVAAMMMVAPTFALAEAAPADAAATAPVVVGQTEAGVDIYDLTTEVSFAADGLIVPFTDDNFQLTIPSNWVDMEISEELTAKGVYMFEGLEDMSQFMYVMYTPVDTIGTLDDVIAGVAAGGDFTEVVPVMFNGVQFVTYTDLTNNQFGCVTVDASQSGYLWFMFGPNDSADLNSIAVQVMSSIAPIAADATEGAAEGEATDDTAEAATTEG